jgi:hypothetical protein
LQGVADPVGKALEFVPGAEKHGRRLAEQPLRLPTEQPGCTGIALHDLAVAHGDDADRVVGQQRPIFLQPSLDVAAVQRSDEIFGSLAHDFSNG